MLYSVLQAPIFWRASQRFSNQLTFRHSSRSRPLKLSTLAFCTGLPRCDVALVMSSSEHRSLESFKAYLHPTQQGRMLADQWMKVRWGLLGDFFRNNGNTGNRTHQF